MYKYQFTEETVHGVATRVHFTRVDGWWQ